MKEADEAKAKLSTALDAYVEDYANPPRSS